MVLLHRIFDEKGITDLIYEFSCGISYRNLRKIIKQNFSKVTTKETTIEKLTEYFTKILSNGSWDLENEELEIHIFLMSISGIVSNKCGFAHKLMHKHYPCESLYQIINDTVKQIELINGIKYSTVFYSK